MTIKTKKWKREWEEFLRMDVRSQIWEGGRLYFFFVGGREKGRYVEWWVMPSFLLFLSFDDRCVNGMKKKRIFFFGDDLGRYEIRTLNSGFWSEWGKFYFYGIWWFYGLWRVMCE